jgi:phosphoribosylaminoimidazolecarboxamide formyltransferase/IMP cyclohydrolase
VLEEMKENSGDTTLGTRERLALKVFQRTSAYDAAIAAFLNKEQTTQKTFSISLPLYADLRYGDNPHQSAALYGNFGDYFSKLHGKDLSYTNVIDIQSAAALVHEFRRPTVAILKHTNPCGVGCADEDLREAWDKAFETDKQAPFGGVIVTNRSMTLGLAKLISEIFTDIIIAPDFDADARAHLQKKKNLRLMQMHESVKEALTAPVVRNAPGGILVMDNDSKALGLDDLETKVKTKRPPTRDELEAMRFAWRVVKHVKSNAIVFASADRTLGIGAGQMSRVDSARIAVWKAEQAGLSLKGSVVASDAMFPFADGLIACAEAGATAAIIGGSR